MLKATLAFIAITLFSAPVSAGGIDCTKATDAIDKIICSSDELKAQDKTMNELYALAKVNMFGQGPSGEIAGQRKWLADLKKIDKEPPAANQSNLDKDTENLVEQYRNKIAWFAFDVMPSAPEKALQALHDQKINTAPVFEALTIFASEPDGSDWSNSKLDSKRKHILDLAAPTIQLVLKVDNDPIIKDLMGDDDLSTPESILKSSRAFGFFLRAATYDSDDPRTLPCGYVITHPGLLAATEPNFGSAMDGKIITSNCSEMAPPHPKFDALVTEINDPWPDCEGTIRFAIWGDFSVAQDEALAPSEKLIQEYTSAKAKHLPYENHVLKDVSKSDIGSATRELANYYVKYLKATPQKAAIFAKAKIANILEIGRQCDQVDG